MAIEVRFYAHPATRQPAVTVGLVADLAGIEAELMPVMIQSFTASGFSARYDGEFFAPAEAGDLCMTATGLLALQGHLEASFPGTIRKLEGLRQALGDVER